jgi:HEAT repeat protein
MASVPDPSSAADWLVRRRRLDSLLRLQAAVMIGDPGEPEAIRLLAEALSDSEADVRELAAAALSEFGAGGRAALPALIQAVQDENPVVRRRAIRAIGMIGPDAVDDALAAVMVATDDLDDSVAMQAIATLGEFGPLAASAIPALISAIWTGDVRRRAVAGASLTRMGAAAVPFLIQSLSHPALEVRSKCTHLLGSLGAVARDAGPALQLLLNDRDDGIRAAAGEALRLVAK